MARMFDGPPREAKRFEYWTLQDVIDAEESGRPLPPEVQSELDRAAKIVGSNIAKLFPTGKMNNLSKLSESLKTETKGDWIDLNLNACDWLTAPSDEWSRDQKIALWVGISLGILAIVTVVVTVVV